MTDDLLQRRNFLRGIGALTVAGALAGCSSGSGGSGGSGGSDGSGDSGGSDGSGSDGETTGDSSDDSGSSGGSGGSGSVPSAVSEYLSDVDNFDGSTTDATGQSEVSVTVGSEANGGNFGYDPVALRVDAGTTVTWEWNGKGGSHNVVAEEGGDFESELVAEEGHTFSHTFESSGTVTYFCSPHKSLGMKGAVVVE